MRLKLTAKHSRREGQLLTEKASHARAMARRPFPPGAHGPTNGYGRMTDYGKQLREKQKAKRLYGLAEKQFSNLFEEASKRRGNTEEALVQLLETRLDNTVYRAGFAKTRAAARQAVGHAHFEVNGRKVNIPSFRVKPGDVIKIRANKVGKGLWANVSDQLTAKKDVPSWISLQVADASAKITSVPSGDELRQPFDTKLIIEFYSR